jgi:hypothetical protein
MTKPLLAALLAASALAPAGLAESAAPPAQSMAGQTLKLEELVAKVTVTVAPGATAMTVTIKGDKDLVARITTRQDGDTAVIAMDRSGMDDWDGWNYDKAKSVTIDVVVPARTSVDFEDFIGEASLGDLDAKLSGSVTSADIKAGRLSEVELDVTGSGDIALGDIAGALSFELAGSGSLNAMSAKAVSVDVAGSGAVEIGAVGGDLSVDIAGSGEVGIGSIDSKTDVSIAGSGEVSIKAGRAHALTVDASGSGDFRFGGTAVNPEIDVSGSGSVCIGAVEGSLKASGADIVIDPAACA